MIATLDNLHAATETTRAEHRIVSRLADVLACVLPVQTTICGLSDVETQKTASRIEKCLKSTYNAIVTASRVDSDADLDGLNDLLKKSRPLLCRAMAEDLADIRRAVNGVLANDSSAIVVLQQLLPKLAKGDAPNAAKVLQQILASAYVIGLQSSNQHTSIHAVDDSIDDACFVKADAEFENQHPREADGKFTEKEFEYHSPYRPVLSISQSLPSGYKLKGDRHFSVSKPLPDKLMRNLQLEPLDPEHPDNVKKSYESFHQEVMNKHVEKGVTAVKLDTGTTLVLSENVGIDSDKYPFRITNLQKDGTPSGHSTYRDFSEATLHLFGHRKHIIKDSQGSSARPERQIHTLDVSGSNPLPATNLVQATGMSFDTAMPWEESLKILRDKKLMPTRMSSAELQRIGAGIRERSFFSARVYRIEQLQKLQDIIDQQVRGEINEAEARKQMRQFNDSIGYEPEAGKEDTLQDLSSDERLNLILRTNSQLISGRAVHDVWSSKTSLQLYPCQELYRKFRRIHPRTSSDGEPDEFWQEEWEDLGGTLYDGRMVALKTDPICSEISFFGVPYGPPGFNSGYRWRQVSRDEAIELGVIDEDFEQQEEVEDTDINEDLETSIANLGSAFKSALEMFGYKITSKGAVTL